MPEVVQFPITNTTDIPAKLRELADDIESGCYDKIETAFVLLPFPGDFPRIFGYGDVDGHCDPMIQFQLALHWFCKHMVARS